MSENGISTKITTYLDSRVPSTSDEYILPFDLVQFLHRPSVMCNGN
jgi:hypothetical protein